MINDNRDMLRNLKFYKKFFFRFSDSPYSKTSHFYVFIESKIFPYEGYQFWGLYNIVQYN